MVRVFNSDANPADQDFGNITVRAKKPSVGFISLFLVDAVAIVTFYLPLQPVT